MNRHIIIILWIVLDCVLAVPTCDFLTPVYEYTCLVVGHHIEVIECTYEWEGGTYAKDRYVPRWQVAIEIDGVEMEMGRSARGTGKMWTDVYSVFNLCDAGRDSMLVAQAELDMRGLHTRRLCYYSPVCRSAIWSASAIQLYI